MRQVIQNLANGETKLVEVPAPSYSEQQCLIQTSISLISAGTEKMMVDFGRAGWINKAKQQPDKVRQVLDKIKTDGLMPTLEAVRSKLDKPLPLGYCNVGRIVGTGTRVRGFNLGERVVSNGPHAEVVAASKSLCAKVPGNVSDTAASFTVIGAIALQGVRLVEPTLGETVVVVGLGLIGLMTVQLLIANGCEVIGVDFDAERCRLAEFFGAKAYDLSAGLDPIAEAERITKGRGVDAVIITASTSSNEPIHQAAQMCRKRGRIVLVGVVGMQMSRDDFYKKELSFQVSCSYGPGRYDVSYEEKGQDYPLPYVRWTEQRNFEAVLQMMASGKIDPTSLVSHRFALEEAEKAYELLAGNTSSLGIILEYPQAKKLQLQTTVEIPTAKKEVKNHRQIVKAGLIGAGNYASRVLLPAFKDAGVSFDVISSGGGLSCAHAAKKFNIPKATTDVEFLIQQDELNTVVIATPHSSHAKFVTAALKADKCVFVEKPLAISITQLQEIELAFQASTKQNLMVGFNRRFSPFVQKMKQMLQSVSQPKVMVMTINAGSIPSEHWIQDPQIGAGRIIGEACHFIDLLRFLASSPIASWQAEATSDNLAPIPDNTTITLKFIDGSIGTVHYLANGHRSYPKEKLQVFAAGKILELANFRELKGFGFSGFSKMKTWRQDKGQKQCVKAFVEAAASGVAAPIPFVELLEVAKVTVEISDFLAGASSQ